MSFYILHRWVRNLRKSIRERLQEENVLTVSGYVELFSSCFQSDSVFKIVDAFEVCKDGMYVSARFNEHQRLIYLERQFRVGDEDEEYQLQMELQLDIPFVERLQETFEIKRDMMGDFYSDGEGYIEFADFVESIFESATISAISNLYPDSVYIGLNADV